MLTGLQPIGPNPDGWSTRFIDPVTGEHWTRTYLGAEYHGGGLAILVREPAPTAPELLTLAATSADPAEVAASAWLLSETDRAGDYKDQLVTVAEAAANKGDQARAALLVEWGNLANETNLRSTLGKSPVEVGADHDYFKRIAARARTLLRLKSSDPLLRDFSVFRREVP